MPTTDQFWLLLGDTPAGPFTLAQVHAKLSAGEANWQTRACQLGGSEWLPLVKTPGVGPAVPAPAPPPGTSSQSHTAANPATAPESRGAPASRPTRMPRGKHFRLLIGGVFAVVLLGVIAWQGGLFGAGEKERVEALRNSLPAEYRPFLGPSGKFDPTGDATLDFWIAVNFRLHLMSEMTDQFALPIVAEANAEAIRKWPTAGVDPEVVRWATEVAAVLETKGRIQNQLNDPATPSQATEKARAGDRNSMAELDRSNLAWQRERDRLVAEGKRLREVQSRRSGRAFPPPQL